MKALTALCDVCGEGQQTNEIRDTKTEWRGRTGTVVIRYKTCDACKGEYVDYLDSVHNKNAVLEFRAMIDVELDGSTKETK